MIRITAKQQTALKWETTQPSSHVIKCVSGKQLIIDRAILAPDGKHAQVFFAPPLTITLGGVAKVWPSGYLWIEHWPELIAMFSAPPPASLWGPETMNWKPWLKAYSLAIGAIGGKSPPPIAKPSGPAGSPRMFKPQEFRPTSIAAKFIGHFEGLSLTQYICAAGVSTIGYGTTRWHNGEEIPSGATITNEQALAFFKRDSKEFMVEIQRLVDVPLTARQIAVVLSFCYNCGWQGFGESTLLKVINCGGSPSEAREQLRRWTNGGLAGLVRRRNAEAMLWEGRDDWESAGYD